MIARLALLALAGTLALSAAPALAQAPPLAVAVRHAAPGVSVGPVLEDGALETAVRSGLPLRMRFRVELWRDRVFDQLVDRADWTLVLLYEPLEGRFLLGTPADDSARSYPSYAAARRAVETGYMPALGPTASGRYYYLATLEIETLSLSDLEELRHWLRGELAPAVGGERSVVGAIGRGLRRILIRVLDLPARRYNARSDIFAYP